MSCIEMNEIKKYLETPNSTKKIGVCLTNDYQVKINKMINENLDIMKNRSALFRLMIDYFYDRPEILRELVFRKKD